MKLILLPLFALLLNGCVTVKNAQVDQATFNTAGWKSQAVSGADADPRIDALTSPSTDVSGL